MIYRTTCPHCASIFRVGPDQLEAAQGWVQCSVCGAAFDAYPGLLMADGSPLPTPEPPPVESLATASVEPVAESAVEDPELETPPAAQLDEAPPGEAEHASEPHSAPADAAELTTATPQGVVQRETPLDLPSIILIDPDADSADDPGPLPHISAPAYPAPQNTSAYPPPPAYPAAAPAARVEYAGRTAAGSARAHLAAPRRRIPLWIGLVAAPVLLAALLAQTAYFLRDPLVSRFPQMRPALEHGCAIVGCTLSLPKNPDLLRIVGSDLQTEASGRLKLTLTLGNRASHAQAWPVLVLTLMDQRNRPLARRSFAPSEYLGDTARIAAGIPARSEQGLTLPLTVKDLTPMGFDLRLTY